MDVEKTIEFLLEHQARFDVRMTELTERISEWMERSAEMDERHDREVTDIRALAAETRNDLRRAVRAGIEEQRRERVRRQELDTKITQLAAAQLVTEEKLQRLLDGLSGKNGG